MKNGIKMKALIDSKVEIDVMNKWIEKTIYTLIPKQMNSQN